MSVEANTTFPPPSAVGTMLVMRLPVNVDALTTFQVSPPSVDRATPNPRLPSEARLLELPLPANIRLGFTGLMASERIERAGNSKSVSGIHVGFAAVALVVFQMPPLDR